MDAERPNHAGKILLEKSNFSRGSVSGLFDRPVMFGRLEKLGQLWCFAKERQKEGKKKSLESLVEVSSLFKVESLFKDLVRGGKSFIMLRKIITSEIRVFIFYKYLLLHVI